MRAALRLAFPYSLPVMAGYLVLGLGFGVLLAQAGYGVHWALLMSGGIYAGAMQYVAVDLLISQAGLLQVALVTLLVNARHVFYGLAMAPRYRQAGRYKAYLAFSLTDETFALLSQVQAPPGVDDGLFCTALSLLHHTYWILGSLLGFALGRALPFDLSGVEFSMTALFVVMLVEQWRKKQNRLAVLIGAGTGLVFLLLLGKERFALPAMLVMSGLVLALRPAAAGQEAP